MNSIIHEEEPQGADLEVVPFPCIEVNAKGALIEANRLARTLLATHAKLFGLAQHIHPDDAGQLLAAFRSAASPFDMDCRIAHAQETYHWFMLHACPDGHGAWRMALHINRYPRVQDSRASLER